MISKYITKIYWLLGLPFSLYFAYVITDQTFNFFLAGDLYSYAYNFYFLSILDGTLSVPMKSIGFEGNYLSDGTAFMYYGVGPAFLRALFYPFVDLTQTSVARAVVFLMVVSTGFISQSTYIYCLNKSNLCNRTLFSAALLLGGISIWLASPMLMLGSSAIIFHEPIAFALWCFVAFTWVAIRLVHQPANFAGICIFAALCAALALHGRPHVAIGLYLAICLLLVWIIWVEIHAAGRLPAKGCTTAAIQAPWYSQFSFVLLVGLILGASGIAYMWLNLMKYGSPMAMTGGVTVYGFLFFDKEAPDSIRNIGFQTDGRFNAIRIIPNLVFHAIGGWGLFDQLRGWLGVAYIRRGLPSAGFVFLWLPWIVLCLFGAMTSLHFQRRKVLSAVMPQPMPAAVLVLTALIPLLFITAYGTNTFRYKVEIWPFIWTLSLVLLPSVLRYLDEASSQVRVMAFVLATVVTIAGSGYSLVKSNEYSQREKGLILKSKRWPIWDHETCTGFLRQAKTPSPLPESLCN